MKYFLFVLLLFLNNLFAQTNKDLYISYNDGDLKNRIVSSVDKNSSIEVFQLSIQDKSPYQYVLAFNQFGRIEVQTLITATNFPLFRFTYLNQNGDNPEKYVPENEIKNILEFKEILKLTNADNFYNTISSFENIYFIDLSGRKSKVVAKKVKFERVHGM